MLKPGIVARSSRSVCVRSGVLRGAITRLLGDDALLFALLELAVALLSDSKTSPTIAHINEHQQCTCSGVTSTPNATIIQLFQQLLVFLKG